MFYDRCMSLSNETVNTCQFLLSVSLLVTLEIDSHSQHHWLSSGLLKIERVWHCQFMGNRQWRMGFIRVLDKILLGKIEWDVLALEFSKIVYLKRLKYVYTMYIEQVFRAKYVPPAKAKRDRQTGDRRSDPYVALCFASAPKKSL